jgi:Uma2 family endonuclease
LNHPVEKQKGYRFSDYLRWPEDERWELIRGVAYNMGPAPSRKHQKVSVTLVNMFYNYLKEKDTPCEVYAAPFDVRLPEENTRPEDIQTVVQPDIVIICDKSKLDDQGCKDSPDLIVEIISPATAAKDYITKLALYEQNGVKEYWVVHPIDKVVMVYQLAENGIYGRPIFYAAEDQVEVGIFGSDLVIDMKAVFAD